MKPKARTPLAESVNALVMSRLEDERGKRPVALFVKRLPFRWTDPTRYYQLLSGFRILNISEVIAVYRQFDWDMNELKECST
jgi:hypothetical protein